MFDLEGFKRKEFVVHCESQEQCIKFLTFMAEKDMFVNGCGNNPNFAGYSTRCNNQPCFFYDKRNCLYFDNLAHYERDNYRIEKFNDCFVRNRVKIKIKYLGI